MYGSYVPFWCFTGVNIIILVLGYLFVPETEGKSIEQILLELKGENIKTKTDINRNETIAFKSNK